MNNHKARAMEKIILQLLERVTELEAQVGAITSWLDVEFEAGMDEDIRKWADNVDTRMEN